MVHTTGMSSLCFGSQHGTQYFRIMTVLLSPFEQWRNRASWINQYQLRFVFGRYPLQISAGLLTLLAVFVVFLSLAKHVLERYF